MHINVLERKAAFIGIRMYWQKRSFKHIRVVSDNSTTIVYINNKGDIKSKKCNELAKEIWLWSFRNNYFISAAHIPGKQLLKQTSFLENLTIIQTSILTLGYILKLLKCLATQKLIFLLPG